MQYSHVVDEDHVAFAHGQRYGVRFCHEVHGIDSLDLSWCWSWKGRITLACREAGDRVARETPDDLVVCDLVYEGC